MQKIKIYTNHISGGWEPENLKNFLGGSEEVVILLAEELSKQYDVTIYHTPFEDNAKTYNQVKYLNRDLFESQEQDIIISFKDHTIFDVPLKCKKKIHWSSDVEKPWNTDNIDYFVHLTNYHKSRHLWLDYEKSIVIPHGIDKISLNQNKQNKEKDTLLYCSSPDRGLEHLLQNWSHIKKIYPKLKLKVTYGFSYFDRFAKNNVMANQYKENILKLMSQKDIEYLDTLNKDEIEKLYWQSEYWILPLQNADSELFCLNAHKTEYCGVIPIVNKIGALINTVGEYISYSDFLNGNIYPNKVDKDAYVHSQTWKEVVLNHWNKILI